LKQLSVGDKSVLHQLVPIVYGELRRLASSYMRHERPDHTLQTTALVHEAYLLLVGQERTHWENRGHFFGVAAQLMRRYWSIMLGPTTQRSEVASRPSFRSMKQ